MMTSGTTATPPRVASTCRQTTSPLLSFAGDSKRRTRTRRRCWAAAAGWGSERRRWRGSCRWCTRCCGGEEGGGRKKGVRRDERVARDADKEASATRPRRRRGRHAAQQQRKGCERGAQREKGAEPSFPSSLATHSACTMLPPITAAARPCLPTSAQPTRVVPGGNERSRGQGRVSDNRTSRHTLRSSPRPTHAPLIDFVSTCAAARAEAVAGARETERLRRACRVRAIRHGLPLPPAV